MNWYKIAKSDKKMPKRKLGKTNYQVSIFSLGGQGALEEYGTKDNSLKIIQRAYELGINYFDTSPVYGNSEDYYGEVIPSIRKNIFLATKTDDRTRDGSLKLIEKSLKRLNTNYVDLWQIHHLDEMKEVDDVCKKDGALQALIEMKEQKVVRFLGFSGHHDPDVLLKMMNRYDFDTILCPVNAGDVHMKPSFIKEVLSKANEKNMGIIGMKIFSQGYIFHPEGIKTTWEVIFHSLNQNLSTIIVGHDSVEQLEENISIAKSFYPLTPKQEKEIEEKVKDYLKRACFFRKEFKGYSSKEKLGDPYIIENVK